MNGMLTVLYLDANRAARDRESRARHIDPVTRANRRQRRARPSL